MMKPIRNFLLTLLASVSVPALPTPLILPVDDPEAEGTHRVTWSTDPGSRYELQQSADLAEWTTVAGFPTEAADASMEHAFVIGGDRLFFRVHEPGPAVPEGFALIPAGPFLMGATTNMGHESYPDETPQHEVYVSAYFIEQHEVTKALWDEVRAWGLFHGYPDLPPGEWKGANHPIAIITWHDAVKWCNARSEKEGLTPVYYTDAGLTTVFRTGNVDITNDWVMWGADGYRLPTEAEWEKAARGGTPGHRFPWSDSDEIQHSRANYRSSDSFAYDTSLTRDLHPTFYVGIWPCTNPVDYFAPNGYGLYGMAGNLSEWCWDWHSSSYYGSSPANDPKGPVSGSHRLARGGGWPSRALDCRVARREYATPSTPSYSVGFRCVRAAGQ